MRPTLEQIRSWAVQAGAILRAGYGRQLDIQYKGAINLVTDVDQRSEAYLLGEINAAFPEHTIITEESGLHQGNRSQCWYIDPLDGTVNYAHAIPVFCVSIAYAEDGVLLMGVVYDPMRDECFSAERGQGAYLNGERLTVSAAADLLHCLMATGFPYDRQTARVNNLDNFTRLTMLTQGVRRLGSAALDLCYVASGRLDGYWELSLEPWDVAAGVLIVEEAGGVVSRMSGTGNLLEKPISVVAANPVIHPLLLAELKA